ncbi:BHLH domain-containing protein [Aphelenchoides besseyi]|nr:BHLH domain-containing protein [Aphelenchoides besseyi]
MNVEDDSHVTEAQDSLGVLKRTKKRSAASKIYKLTSKATTTRRLKVAEPFVLSHKRVKKSIVSIQRLLNPNFESDSVKKLRCSLQNQNLLQNENQVRSESPLDQMPILSPVHRRKRLTNSHNQGSVEKRNARERVRVHQVNQAFHALKYRLPSLKTNTKRVSKLRILKTAINYIYNLNDQAEELGLSGIIKLPQSSKPTAESSSPTIYNPFETNSITSDESRKNSTNLKDDNQKTLVADLENPPTSLYPLDRPIRLTSPPIICNTPSVRAISNFTPPSESQSSTFF